MNTVTTKRVLAIDPSTRGFGFAVLEGAKGLIDWGVKEARGVKDKNKQCLELIEDLIRRYRPDVIMVEDVAGKDSRRVRRVQELIQRVQKLATREKVRIRSVSPFKVKVAFSPYGAFTKHQIATAIAQRFPELAPRLPPIRKPWMPEDYRMPIFDAVALAITFFDLKNRDKRAA